MMLPLHGKKDPERKREIERLQAENPKRLRNVYKVVDFGETSYQNKAGEKEHLSSLMKL